MARLTALDPEETTGKSKVLFDSIHAKLGMVPNMMRTMGNSPAVLNGYLGFNSGLNSSSISSKLRELIAISVANVNGCDYCNSAHSYTASKIGITPRAIQDAQQGISEDVKINAALIFANEILVGRGAVSDNAIKNIKASGYTEGEIIEIVAQVSLSIFTNYINIVASTDIDFPKQPPIKK